MEAEHCSESIHPVVNRLEKDLCNYAKYIIIIIIIIIITIAIIIIIIIIITIIIIIITITFKCQRI